MSEISYSYVITVGYMIVQLVTAGLIFRAFEFMTGVAIAPGLFFSRSTDSEDW